METFSALLANVRGIHRSPMNSPHKGQWRGSLMFSLICAWINAWVNNRAAGDMRRHCAHYCVIVVYHICNGSWQIGKTLRLYRKSSWLSNHDNSVQIGVWSWKLTVQKIDKIAVFTSLLAKGIGLCVHNILNICTQVFLPLLYVDVATYSTSICDATLKHMGKYISWISQVFII